MKQPEYIFETSWEVCNKVGGIYAVLSTRAATMQAEHPDKVFFLGPDLWQGQTNPYFRESTTVLKDWVAHFSMAGLRIRVGRWQIPGKPIAILIDFSSLWHQKNDIYAHVWEQFQVSSMQAYGDYDSSSLFGYAAGMVIESLYKHLTANRPLFIDGSEATAVAHFNEWQTAFGLFYVREHLPQIGTLFTTHATGIGRSIAGNHKPLYDYFNGYNGDQMASELNMVSKHSVEKQAAHAADCFTTVSQITAKECKQLLDKAVDIVTPNGFEDEFVPHSDELFASKRIAARKTLMKVAEKVLGQSLQKDALLTCISGRYEFKNKGIDALLTALSKLRDMHLRREVVCFIMVPAWQQGAHQQLGAADNITTHQLVQPDNDPILNTMQFLRLNNQSADNVKIIFVPSYLKGDDGIFGKTYYDLLIGMDLTIFPSYYEPWGYTPLESIAFHVPTITTDLAGFGQWAAEQQTIDGKLKAVSVIHRTDSNWDQMTTSIAQTICDFLNADDKQVKQLRQQAAAIAEKALWKHFFKYYHRAYCIAINKASNR